ncbi:MAG TPA: TraR/DksA family transcriptional regulator [Vicinamibacterales bacterium]|jgi:phage/conjugal plasmid C-4 type zinc finger TraR family protein|nr:TraR/DksA family transcriptional regulator [Vicinamibacterales bacterium]
MSDVKAEERLERELTAILTCLRRWSPQPEGSPQSIARLAGDLVDDAQAVETLERNHLGYARLAQRARRLTAALARLRDGSYGRCDECEKPIPPARLHALPGVTTCVPCQEEVERLAGAGRR